jgi:hypothetical protein
MDKAVYNELLLRHIAMRIKSPEGDLLGADNPRALREHINSLHTSAFNAIGHAEEAKTTGLLYPLRGVWIRPTELFFRFYEAPFLDTPYAYDGSAHQIVCVSRKKGVPVSEFLICKGMVAKAGSDKKAKRDVNYREGTARDNCAACKFFHYGDKTCDLVLGYIDPLATCDLFKVISSEDKAAKLASVLFTTATRTASKKEWDGED